METTLQCPIHFHLDYHLLPYFFRMLYPLCLFCRVTRVIPEGMITVVIISMVLGVVRAVVISGVVPQITVAWRFEDTVFKAKNIYLALVGLSCWLFISYENSLGLDHFFLLFDDSKVDEMKGSVCLERETLYCFGFFPPSCKAMRHIESTHRIDTYLGWKTEW